MARRNTLPTAEAGALDSIRQVWHLAAVVIVAGRSFRVLVILLLKVPSKTRQEPTF